MKLVSQSVLIKSNNCTIAFSMILRNNHMFTINSWFSLLFRWLITTKKTTKNMDRKQHDLPSKKRWKLALLCVVWRRRSWRCYLNPLSPFPLVGAGRILVPNDVILSFWRKWIPQSIIFDQKICFMDYKLIKNNNFYYFSWKR